MHSPRKKVSDKVLITYSKELENSSEATRMVQHLAESEKCVCTNSYKEHPVLQEDVLTAEVGQPPYIEDIC